MEERDSLFSDEQPHNKHHRHRMAFLVCLFSFFFYSNDLRFIPDQSLHIQWTLLHAGVDFASCFFFAALFFWMMVEHKLKEAVLLSSLLFLAGIIVLLYSSESSLALMLSLFLQSAGYSMFCILGPRFTTLWLPFKQRMLYFALFGLALYLGDLLQSAIITLGFNGVFQSSQQYYYYLAKLLFGFLCCILFTLLWREPTFLPNNLSHHPFDKFSLAFRFILGNSKFLRITISHTLLFPMSYDQDSFLTGALISLTCILASILVFLLCTVNLKHNMKRVFSYLILLWSTVLIAKITLKYFEFYESRPLQIAFNSVTYFFDTSGYILSQEYCFDLLFPFNPVYIDLFQIIFTKLAAILFSLLLYYIHSSLWLYLVKLCIIAISVSLALSLKTDYRPLF